MSDLRDRGPGSPEPRSETRSALPHRDGRLVDAIASGQQGALAQAYSQHASRVHALARGLCGPTRADDLTQEIFLQLWKDPQRYSAERGSLRTFLLMQAHSRAVDIIRSDRARAARESARDLAPKPQPADTDAAALAVLERAEVQQLVDALPESERQAILLAYFGGNTYREVAQLLGVPEGTVKSRIRSGLNRLRAELSRRNLA